jgi:diaminohydroxyphosphoribosylaminopyrimidine deaminase/5-amino-6-(5-phosphoribosylamino)uracil reductase
MTRALALAERGRGRTSPNPMVGAVVVDREGVVVGRGAHLYAGGPHAEIDALQDAGDRARGATLYCTLEPCSHVGRTGPCAPRVADAGIARVVAAIEDPNPLVSGAGLAHLRARGLDVAVGVMREEARRLNRPFFTVMQHGRPFVTMKVALSRDGRMAAAPGVRTPLTGAAANRAIHRDRAEVDAIAVGSGTILADDPMLTARGAYRHRPLTRVVFDARLRTPQSARVLSTLEAGPVIIMSTPSAAESAPDRIAALAGVGADVRCVAGHDPLRAGLEALAALGISSVIVEGGAALHRAFWDAGLVDRVQMYVTPRTLGPGGLEWLPTSIVSGAAAADLTTRQLGEDQLIEAYVHRPD